MRAPRVVAAALIGLSALVPLRSAAADSIGDKQREATALASKIDQLQSKAESLTEDANQAALDLQAADAAVGEARVHLTQQQGALATLRTQMSSFALKSYVYADESTGVATLLDPATLDGEAAGRDGYAALAMGANTDLSDAMRSALEDTDRQRVGLEAKLKRQQQLTQLVAKQQAAVGKATTAAQAALTSVKGDLVQLVAEAQARQQAAAAAAQQAAIERQQAADAAAARSTPIAGASGVTSSGSRPRILAAPPPAPGAAGAVRAALSQVGGRYVAFKASPATGFDCSGLTMWAWAQAGVSLPHYSRAQYASLPHVSIDQLQPGDLVFEGNPIHHVAMYIGGGRMVEAASPRLGIIISPIHNLVGAARP